MGNCNSLCGSKKKSVVGTSLKQINDTVNHPFEIHMLKLIFKDLQERDQSEDISKEGLWNERLYRIFDYDESNSISYMEFLIGISKFVKEKKEQKIHMLFQLYDLDGNGCIEKHEFLKMLFNYPHRDIDQLASIWEEFLPKAYKMQNFRANRNSLQNLFDQSHVFNAQSRRSSIFVGDNNNVQQSQLTFIPQIQEQIEKSKIFQKIMKNEGFFKNEVMPTTFNNKIKMLAEIIYKKYAVDGSLNYQGFHEWICLHFNFLKTFDSCFRPHIWQYEPLANEFEKTNYELLKFKLEQLIDYKHNKEKFKCFAKIQGIFLYFQKDAKDKLPFRIIILKGLHFEFNDDLFSIDITNDQDSYKQTTILFQEESQFQVWKNYLKVNVRDTFFKKYMILDKIGVGKFSEVHKVTKYTDNQHYAMKICRKEGLDQMEKEVLYNEAKIMEVLHHENVIKFYESSESIDSYQYIMELVSGDDLFSYVNENHPIGEQTASQIMLALIEAMHYIHNTGIIHRDLKPENVMLEYEENSKKITKIKLIDFGLSTYTHLLKIPKHQLIRCGTVNYMAPEVIDNEQGYDERCDIFSLGVIMFFCLTKSLPFEHEKSSVVRNNITKGLFNLNVEQMDASVEAKRLLDQMLQLDQNKRISLKQALKDPWLTNRSFFHDKNQRKRS